MNDEALNDKNYLNDNFFSDLYYGSIEKLVYLIPCPGKILQYNQQDTKNIRNSESIQSSLDNFHKLQELGEEYKHIHCIGIPANDIFYIGKENQWEPNQNYNKKLFTDGNKTNNINENKDLNISETLFENKVNSCFIKFSKELIEKENLKRNDYIIGFQSGKRSCIVKIKDRYYRLKGCGNLNEGFSLQYMNFPKGSYEIRGCQYRYSALRESHMTYSISEILSKKYDLLTTNLPKCIWEYGKIDSEKLCLKNELIKIKKYCSIFESIGEKRLGCHLFPGIELILARLIDNYIKEKFILYKLSEESIKDFKTFEKNCENLIENLKDLEINMLDLFEDKRIEKTFPSKNKFIINEENKNDLANKENYLNNIYKFEKQIIATSEVVGLVELDREKGENLTDLFKKYEIYRDISSGNAFKRVKQLLLNNEKNSILQIFSYKNILQENSNLQNYFNLNFILEELPNLYKNTDNCENNKDFYLEFSELKSSILFRIERIFKFLRNSKMNFLDFISSIYEKIGYEAGKLKRIFQEENINWGTYEDLPFRFHSNAHTDNYSVIPRKINEEKISKGVKKNINLLSILDFDLAFFKDNFFNILAEDKEKFGKPDDNLYDFYINNERQVLEWEISGMENFISFDNLKNKFENNEIFNFIYKPVIYLLRDSAVLGYRRGYLLENFEDQVFFNNNYGVIYDLIELSLLKSNNILG